MAPHKPFVRVTADELFQVADGADINLRARQESRHYDIHRKTSLDAGDDLPLNHLVFVPGPADLFPESEFIGLILLEADHPDF